MGYNTDGLTFNTLRDANVKRLDNSKYVKCESEWTTAHWVQALVGEVGELANILKKVDRGDYDECVPAVREQNILAIANELADIQCYLDILALKLNVNLGEATMRKFNVVSKRIGSQVWIDANGTHWGPINEH